MKKVVTPLIFAISFMFTSIANANVILSLDPGEQDIIVGDLVSVNLMIDGLGDGTPLSLASFDLDISFDTSALSFDSYQLFDGLGDIDLFEAEDWSLGDLGGGIVNLSEISWLSNAELWGSQPGSFALAELFFRVEDAPKTSQISLDAGVLVDVNGDLINVIGVNNATVNAVPTPANSLLMALGLLVLFARKKHSLSNIERS